MKTGISKSVGRSGVNNKDDVIFIQTALNNHAKKHTSNTFPLKVDGICGAKTIQAIYNLQRNHVGITAPDSRVDPHGRTLRHLTDSSPHKNATHQNINPTPISFKLNEIQVTYASDVPESRRIVSAYSINVIKLALLESNMTHAVITSTLRTPEDQAEIMYKNATINLTAQLALYGEHGKTVLNVFKNNKNKEKDDVIKLMADEIESLLKRGNKTSQHCTTIENFKSLNTFDIGLNSTRLKSRNFNKEKLTQAFNDLTKKCYIKKFIDETKKSNSCWHIEIRPHSKDINLYKKESMLLPSISAMSRYV